MKKIPSLPTVLRVIFGVARLLILLGGACMLLAVVVPLPGGHAADRITLQLPFEALALKLPGDAISLKSPTARLTDIQITRFPLALTLNVRTSDPGLASAIRWTLLPRTFLDITCVFILCGLLRDLCRRAEHGEIFIEANFRSLRSLGFLLAGFPVADITLQLWSAHYLGGYLEQHATLVGIDAAFQTELTNVPYGDIITGLLVLLVAEAFRQGLVLKQESDLTV